MTRWFRSVCLLAALFLASAASLAKSPSDPRAGTTAAGARSATALHPADTTVPSRVGLREQPSFWDDSTKAIKAGGWDIGSWIAYRRQLLVEASLTNRYFWFCITSFLANVVLMYLFYASRVSEDRKLWKATRAMTDLWNWALFADWTARAAIDKFNTHIEQCSRAAVDGLSLPAISSVNRDELARLQNERDVLQQEVTAMRAELVERDRVITNLNTRVDEVATTVSAGSDTQVTAQLMEKVNMLTVRNQHLEQQLATAQSKLEQWAQGVS
jgi:hypothetical protein